MAMMMMMKPKSKKLKLLKHQHELFADVTTKIIGLVSGFGGGKSWIMARKAVNCAIINAGSDILCTEPTYPMIDDILIPELEDSLDFFGIPYKYNASKRKFHTIINGKRSKIFCRSMENHKRLIGINVAGAFMDELDTSDPEVAYKAYQKVLGRLRAGKFQQLGISSTPEGYRALYKIFVEEAGPDKKLIRARTEDNRHLPPGYIDLMRSQYPENLIDAYLNGQFVNLAGNNVYEHFKRSEHDLIVEVERGDDITIGVDFNIGGCVAIHSIDVEGVTYIFRETVHHDTFQMAAELSAMYSSEDHYVTIIPDASGGARKTNATISDIDILRNAGFMVVVKRSNPRVKDRTNAVNNELKKGLLKVDVQKCGKLAIALERQCWTEKGEPEKFTGPATIDDYNDALGYLVHFRSPIIKPGFKQY
jgi:PBSX family phage terminase large subunit